jgi:fructokinase
VFGEALVDEFSDSTVVGGAPFNVARHLAGLGFSPLMITRIGADSAAHLILREFERFSMTAQGVQIDSERPTGRVRVTQSLAGPHSFQILSDQAYDFIESAPAIAAALPADTAPLYFGSLAQRCVSSRRTLALLSALWRAPTYLDLNWRSEQIARAPALELIEKTDTLKLNDTELRLVLAWCDINSESLRSAPPVAITCPQIADLMPRCRANLLIVTYGDRGYAAFDRAGVCIAAGPAPAIAGLVDTVGAGDAFSAIVLVGQIAAWPIGVTLERASQFATAICAIRGAVPTDLAFYRSWRDRWGHLQGGPISHGPIAEC